MRTSLTTVPGIGKQTARKLLKRFGSVERLRKMSVDELSGALSRSKAEKLHEFLQTTR